MRNAVIAIAVGVTATAVAFIAGGGGAVAQDGTAPAGTTPRAFIASISADTTAAPSGGSSALVTAGHLGASTVDGLGRSTPLTVYGDVHNGLDHPIDNVEVSVTASWPGGSDTRTSSVGMNVPAGATAPFTAIMGPGPGADAQLAATVASYDDMATGDAISGLTTSLGSPTAPAIGPPDKVTGVVPLSDNLFAVSGVVVNTTAHPVRLDTVAVAVYDSQGDVQLVGSTGNITAAYPGPDPNVLTPGEGGTFVVYLPRAALLAIPGSTVISGFVSAEPAP